MRCQRPRLVLTLSLSSTGLAALSNRPFRPWPGPPVMGPGGGIPMKSTSVHPFPFSLRTDTLARLCFPSRLVSKQEFLSVGAWSLSKVNGSEVRLMSLSSLLECGLCLSESLDVGFMACYLYGTASLPPYNTRRVITEAFPPRSRCRGNSLDPKNRSCNLVYGLCESVTLFDFHDTFRP